MNVNLMLGEAEPVKGGRGVGEGIHSLEKSRICLGRRNGESKREGTASKEGSAVNDKTDKFSRERIV